MTLGTDFQIDVTGCGPNLKSIPARTRDRTDLVFRVDIFLQNNTSVKPDIDYLFKC